MTGTTTASNPGPIALTYKVEVLPDADMQAVYQMTNEMREIADNHDGTLIWETAFAGREGYGYERYRDKTAFLEHLQALEPLFARIAGLWKTTTIVPTTTIDAEVQAMLLSFGATEVDFVVESCGTAG